MILTEMIEEMILSDKFPDIVIRPFIPTKSTNAAPFFVNPVNVSSHIRIRRKVRRTITVRATNSLTSLPTNRGAREVNFRTQPKLGLVDLEKLTSSRFSYIEVSYLL